MFANWYDKLSRADFAVVIAATALTVMAIFIIVLPISKYNTEKRDTTEARARFCAISERAKELSEISEEAKEVDQHYTDWLLVMANMPTWRTVAMTCIPLTIFITGFSFFLFRSPGNAYVKLLIGYIIICILLFSFGSVVASYAKWHTVTPEPAYAAAKRLDTLRGCANPC